MTQTNLPINPRRLVRLPAMALCLCFSLVSFGQMYEDEFDEFAEFEDVENEMDARMAAMKVADPLRPLNRGIFWFNDKLYFWLIKPVAQGYGAVVPEKARVSVDNFFANVRFPVRFVNNVLQLKWRGAGVELGRFSLNSTLGLAGLFDPAESRWGLRPHDEDFGQTLGHYGVGSIMALQLPLAGPINLRDAIGKIPDYFLDPLSYIEQWEWDLAVKTSERVNFASLRIGLYESAKDEAVDPYLFLQNAYEQRRQKLIEE